MSKKERIYQTLTNKEFPSFKLELMFVRWKGGKKDYVYIKTSSILKSIGVKDSVSSLLNSEVSTGSEKKYPDLWNNINTRGKHKGAYYFNYRDFETFLNNYYPNRDDRRELWQYYRSWVIDVLYKGRVEVNEEEEEPKPKPKMILLTLTQTAKMLDCGIKKDLAPLLVSRHFLYRQNGFLMPYQQHQTAGHFRVLNRKPRSKHVEGTVPQTMVTPRGFQRIKSLWETYKGL